MTDCVFCRIVAGDAPAELVEHGRHHIVIRPLGPHVPDHLLFIPRRHVPDATTDPWLTGALFTLAADFLDRMLCDGNLLTSVGASATQTVQHLHVHLLPRSSSDGLPTDWPWMRDGR